MIFLVEYDRPTQTLLQCKPFEDSQREEAWTDRLALELKCHREGHDDREIGLFQAENEEAFRKTHGRYFKNVEQLVEEYQRGTI